MREPRATSGREGGGMVASRSTSFGDLVPDPWATRPLYEQCTFAEGPVWFAEHTTLVWSDIPQDRMLAWTPDGTVRVFRQPSGCANGNTRDRQGRLVTCEHLTRRVTRTEADGSVAVLSDSFQGKRLNSPNDIVVKSDDTIWFSDPQFGILGDWEGDKAKPEQENTNVFRIEKDGKLT